MRSDGAKLVLHSQFHALCGAACDAPDALNESLCTWHGLAGDIALPIPGPRSNATLKHRPKGDPVVAPFERSLSEHELYLKLFLTSSGGW